VNDEWIIENKNHSFQKSIAAIVVKMRIKKMRSKKLERKTELQKS